MNAKFQKKLGVCAALLLCSVSSQSFAQESDAGKKEEEAGRKEAARDETIVVTADRRGSYSQDYLQAGAFRDARIIDTPLTVAVASKELLDAQQVVSIIDAARNTAGVTQAQINANIFSNLAIRGIAVDNVTNYRLNGVLPIINFVDVPVENKDRVEVLKGAAGLFYGFAAPSGIVNLVSSRAGNDPVTNLNLSGDVHGSFAGHADIGRKWGDFGLRVNAGAGSLESGMKRSKGDRFFVSAAADWKPTDSLTIQLDADYVHKSITETFEYFLLPNSAGKLVPPPFQAASKNLGSDWMVAEGYEYNLLARVRYDFAPGWDVSVAAGESYLSRGRSYSSFFGYDLATGNGTLSLALTRGNDYRARILRADVSGTFNTGPIEHNVLAGLSYYTRDTNIPRAVRSTMLQNLYDPVAVPEQASPARIIINTSAVTEKAAFIFERASLGEWLNLYVGFRKTDYEDLGQAANGTGVLVPSTAYKDKPGTWSYGFLVKPIKWVSVYGNYIEGLESGLIAPQIAANAGEVLPAALSQQYEFGVKLEPLRGLLITGAYFDIDRPSTYLNSSNRFVQDGSAKYKGFEFSAAGEIGANLSISLSGMILDAKQTSGAAAVVGKQIENVSKFSGSAFVEYRIPGIEGLRASAGAFRVGRRAINATNAGFVSGYTTFDLGLRYETEIGGVPTEFRLYGSNVTGKKYWAATGSSLLQQAMPGNVKFSIAMKF